MALQSPPQMSPEGAFWWDGQTWQPVQNAASQVPPPPTFQDLPKRARPAKPSAPRSTIGIAAAAANALTDVGGGGWARQNMRGANAPPPSTRSAAPAQTGPAGLN